MKVVGLIQARMGSARLAGKVMLPLAGRPLVWHILERLRAVETIAETVLATTQAPENEPLVRWAAGEGVTVVRHPAEDDIAGRLAMAMEAAAADVIVKINADCPLVDPVIVRAGLDMLAGDASADGATNKLRPSYPLGYSVEILGRRAIDWCDRNLSSPEDRELAVKWIFDHPDRFRILSLEGADDDSRLNLTLDTPADYAFISEIFDTLFVEGQCFGWRDVKEFLSNRAVLPVCAYRDVVSAA